MSVKVGAGAAWQTLSDGAAIMAGAGATHHQMQKISVGAGGTWHEVWTYDVTGPTVRAFTVVGQSDADMRFAWSGGALVTDAGSGVASVKIQRQYTPYGGAGEGWVDVDTLISSEWEATSGSFDFAPSTSKRRQWAASWPYAATVSRYYMGFRVVAVDGAGNTTTTAEVKALTKPYGTFNVVPTEQDTYRSGAWRGYTSHAVRSGDSGTVVEEYGCYFYGTAIAEACDGYTPNSGQFYIQRYLSNGSSGTWNMYLHNLATKSGAATLSGTAYGAAISGSDDFETCTMPADWLAPLAAGTAKGIAVDSVTAYRVLRNWLEDFSDSGHLWLNFT